jgi:hypothetical protein
MTEKIHAYRILVSKPEEKKPIEYIDLDERIILRIILKWMLKNCGREWTGFMSLKTDQ